MISQQIQQKPIGNVKQHSPAQRTSQPDRSADRAPEQPSAVKSNNDNATQRNRRRRYAVLAVCLVIGLGIVGALTVMQSTTTPISGYEVINVYPHDPKAFCQGLVFDDGRLYEGTGLYRESTLREVELQTGKVLRAVDLSPRLFGEGIAVWEDRLVQLTWKSGVALVYDKQTFKQQQTLRYSGQGWGLTFDGEHFILSDGSSTLRFLDPKTFHVVRRVGVHSDRGPVKQLNELEYIDGEIYANLWKSDFIARISPADGHIIGWIDLRGLLDDRQRDKEDVLNGIAYDRANGRLFVTGKNWPKLFEIRVTDPR